MDDEMTMRKTAMIRINDFFFRLLLSFFERDSVPTGTEVARFEVYVTLSTSTTLKQYNIYRRRSDVGQESSRLGRSLAFLISAHLSHR